MNRKSQRVSFDNQFGQKLVGVVEQPVDDVRAHAVFAHCFTCGKDLKFIVRLSRKLTEYGVAVFRFDFTGLYESEGNFSDTNLSSNIADVLSAVEFMEREFSAPELLIGHSLGGTAMTIAASQIESAKALVTIASPSSTERLAGFLESRSPQIASEGEGQVNIGGFDFTLKRQLLEDLRSHQIETSLAELPIPMLMFYSPQDETLPYDWGLKMFEAAGGIKNFITLDGADHLLLDPADIEFVAQSMVTWSNRYLV